MDPFSCPPLPIELQDMILDSLLESDKEAARPLAAVCQHWRLKIYRHTFADTTITQHTITSFSHLIETPFSCVGILPAIKSLLLRTSGVDEQWSDPGLVALNCALVKMAHWTKLISLELAKDGTVGCKLGLQHFSSFSFPFLTNLTIRRLTFLSPKDFIGFFGFFPALKHVDFDDVRCEWPDGTHGHTLPSGDFMLALVIHSVSAHRTTIKWTLDGPVSLIKPEDLYNIGWLTQVDIQTLLRKFGPCVRKLDIDFQLQIFQYSTLLQQFVDALDLSVTPRLRHIRIGSSNRVLSFMHWLPQILYGLAKTNHPCLDILEIRFASSRQFHLDRPFLRCLTLGLESPQYSAIKKINFIAYHDSIFDKDVEKAITQTIQNDLLRWHEQGVLGLTFRPRELPL